MSQLRTTGAASSVQYKSMSLPSHVTPSAAWTTMDPLMATEFGFKDCAKFTKDAKRSMSSRKLALFSLSDNFMLSINDACTSLVSNARDAFIAKQS